MYGRQIVIRPRILPAVRSVSEVFLNYTKDYRYVEHFDHISEAKLRAKFYACDFEEGILYLEFVYVTAWVIE